MFRWLLALLFLVAVAAGLIIGVLNPESTRLDLLLIDFRLPLGALVIVAMSAGIVLGLALALVLFVLPARLVRRGRRERRPGTDVSDQRNA